MFKKDEDKKNKDNTITNNIHNEIYDNANYCETKDEIVGQEEKQEPLENKKLENKWSFSSIYFCCCQKKKEWYKQANKIIDNRLDIFYYIRKMILFEFIIGNYLKKINQEEINYKSRIFQYIYLNEDKNLEYYYKCSKDLKIDELLNDFKKKENRKEEDEDNNENENSKNNINKSNDNRNNENKNIEDGMIIYRRNPI